MSKKGMNIGISFAIRSIEFLFFSMVVQLLLLFLFQFHVISVVTRLSGVECCTVLASKALGRFATSLIWGTMGNFKN
jgi:hypothetical protein